MGPIVEGCLALLCAAGIAALVWLLFGWLARPSPVHTLQVILPGRGDGETLEGDLRWLSWLRRAGLFQGEAVIWDRELTPQGRELALRLTLRWPGVVLWPAGELKEYIAGP